MNKKKVTTEGGGLSASQQDAIRLLVSGCTAKYAALVLRLNHADLRRWMNKDVQFQSELAAQVEKRRAQASDCAETSQEKKPGTRKAGAGIMKATRRVDG